MPKAQEQNGDHHEVDGDRKGSSALLTANADSGWESVLGLRELEADEGKRRRKGPSKEQTGRLQGGMCARCSMSPLQGSRALKSAHI